MNAEHLNITKHCRIAIETTIQDAERLRRIAVYSDLRGRAAQLAHITRTLEHIAGNLIEHGLDALEEAWAFHVAATAQLEELRTAIKDEL